jgi:thiol:disulfide interchange protein DsbD
MKAFYLSLILFLTACFSVQAAESESVDTGKVVASLVSSHDSVEAGQTIHVALRTILDPGWHTYWANPGDSGEPVQLSWNLPEGWETGEIVWPLPLPIPTGPIINYGFEGAPLFPVSLTVPENATPGTVETLTLDFYYLVCKDICIPEDGSASIDLLIGNSVMDTRWDALIKDAINTAPKPSDIKAAISQQDNQAVITLQNLPAGDFSESYFFPYDQGVVVHSDPQIINQGSEGLMIKTSSDYGWNEGFPDTIKGVLSYTQDGVLTGSEVTLSVGKTLDIGTVTGGNSDTPIGSITLIGAVFGALIGGLILNLMPCVFPVISMKALSIAKTAHGERSVIRREAWAYTAGVLVTFFVLTALLLALKAAGNEIGWGFQLQSPPVVAILALLLFAVGLNLLGIFEFGTALQNTGSELTQTGGVRGSFFTGLLAVVVATPCTAPFMAGAIGYALAQPAFVTLMVFMALALGFALPFLLIAYVPNVLKALPKPGPWMVKFKEILAFPMFAAAIWLVWVVSLQAGANGMAMVLISMLFVALAIWLFKSTRTVSKGLAVAAIIAALVLSVSIKTEASSAAELNAQAWSHEKVAELRGNGQAVFVDFTAAWCVTCKVNEKLVLDQKRVKDLFVETNTAFLIADWTNKDDVIAAELEAYGRAGVPLYLVFPPAKNGQVDNSVKGEVLPQVLTYDVIKDALERANKTS